jgi:hypothetical protein
MRDQTIYITPDSAVKSVTIDGAGAGYITAPTVTFSSVDSGSGAAGIARINAGIVTAVHMTNGGQGYESAPLISFSGGGGTGALGTAVLSSGIAYNFENKHIKSLLTEDGFGMPPIEFITQRGPFQHGENLRDYFLRPRTMQLLIRRNGCSRDEYWTNRLALIDLLRPNRVQSNCNIFGVLRRVLPDGRKFDIKVVAAEGPGFGQVSDKWDEFSYQEAIRFVAYDPTFYNPTLRTFVISSVETSLVFGNVDPPSTSTFGWVFGLTNGTYTLNYPGTWKTYPIIRIYGPQDTFSITNNTTGKVISLSYDILAGTYIQIGLSYGAKYVQLNDGTNLIGYISGDLATFAIEPGTNEFEVNGTNEFQAAPNTPRVEMYYYERYIGV